MRKIKVHNLILYLIIFILIGIIIILNKNLILNTNKVILKNLDSNPQLIDLNNTINSLQNSHTEYSNYIQTSKTRLAQAISNAGITTSGNDTFETMISNVSNILTSSTSDATATESTILEGQTAYVNGTKINGTMANIGTWKTTPTTSTKVTIPAGYHDGSGYVDTSSVYTAGYNSGAANKEKTILAFFAPNYRADWTEFSSLTNYINAGNSYTIPQTGTYTFTIRVSRTYSGTGQLRWLKNGTIMNTYSCNGTTPNNISIQVSLSQGDVITCDAYNSTETGTNTSILKITL